MVVAASAGAVIAAQWATHVAVAYASGMTHPDTLWYHQPFAVRFLQQHSFTGLEGLGYSESRYFPFNSELVHALATMPFDRDVLSPLVNVGWAALALLAAWCIGRRRGLGPVCVLGALVVLGLPTLAGTQPGQASNDVAGAALLLAAIALLLETEELTLGPTVLAGIAAGLALATKLSVAVPLVVLTVGVVVMAWRAGRRGGRARLGRARHRVRRLLVRAQLGGRRQPAAVLRHQPRSAAPSRARRQSGPALIGRSHRLVRVRRYLRAGLWDGFGRAWPIVLAAGLTGAVLAVARGRPLERVAGAAALAGVVGYVVTPNTAGISFSFNVRYLGPTLLIGFVLLPLVVAERWRRATWIVLAALVFIGATSTQRERIPAWPADELVWGLIVGGVVLATVAWLVRGWSVPTAGAVVVAVVVVVAGGFWLQRYYLDHRYVDAGLHIDEIYESFRDVHDERVAVIGTVEVLPMFGLDLSNRVTQEAGAGGRDAPACTRWAELLDGRDRYVVLDRFGVVFSDLPPEEWFENDPAATEVLRDGESVVYRVEGQLRPAESRAVAGTARGRPGRSPGGWRRWACLPAGDGASPAPA